MRRPVISTLLLALAVVLTTVVLGWPAPALVGALAAFAVRPRDAALAAVLGWGALLAWSLLRGRPSAIVGMVGGLAGAHGPAALGVAAALVLLTLALGALLAWAAATCVGGLLGAAGFGDAAALSASTPGRVTLSGTSAIAPARDPERAPAAQTP